MKKNIQLAYSITMALLTTLLIFAAFAVIPPSMTNLVIICLISLCGYMASYVGYLGYRSHKKESL